MIFFIIVKLLCCWKSDSTRNVVLCGLQSSMFTSLRVDATCSQNVRLRRRSFNFPFPSKEETGSGSALISQPSEVLLNVSPPDSLLISVAAMAVYTGYVFMPQHIMAILHYFEVVQ